MAATAALSCGHAAARLAGLPNGACPPAPARLACSRRRAAPACRAQARAEAEEEAERRSWGRRALLGAAAAVGGPALLVGLEAEAKAEEASEPVITDRVFLDFSLCPTAARLERTLGDSSLICEQGEPMGRVAIGLYGRQVPRTVANFKAMVTGEAGSSYKGTTIHKILQGQYMVAGRQGALDRGEVEPPKHLERNTETVNATSFLLRHSRPGTVSLCLGANDDDDDRKLSSDYRNVEFLITTGPGPAPQLDNGNIVFGKVLEGMDVISAIASVPTYRPSERIRQFNEFAEFLGDDRASKGRSVWNRPLKSVVIRDCGLL